MKTLLKAFPLLLLTGAVLAQQPSSPVLMKINGKPVSKSEFEYIYNKNNSNNSLDKKTLDEYVDLFVNFRLKVEEAKAKGLDTTKSFVNELSGYRSQLTKPYLTDSKVDEEVMQEAYNHMKEDVEVSHILIRVSPNAAPEDTLKAFNKAKDILKRLKTEDFAKVAKEVSEDQSAAENGGKIGWITGFRTVYPFENAAFKTPVGGISQPVRTSFGYHIIYVHNRRKSPGELLTAHIMKFTTKGDENSSKTAKAAIDSIYQLILKGDDFGRVASQLSDDKNSAVKNGELPWFGTGRMVPEFESAAYQLKNIGDISKPIQTPYGWHIIKLIDKKDIGTFESRKQDIERQIKRDERSDKGQEAFVNNLKNEYHLTVNEIAKKEFITALTGKTLIDSTFRKQIQPLNAELFHFATVSVSQAALTKALNQNPHTEKSASVDIINDKVNELIKEQLLAYENNQLEKKYEDFRLLMQEYHDGILLFEISNNEVWDKASKDTEGLAAYFEKNKAEYSWEKPHFKGRIIYCKDQETLKKAKSLVKKYSTDSIDKQLRLQLNDSVQRVRIEKGLYVQGDNKFIDQMGFGLENTQVEPDKTFPFAFVIGKILKNAPEDYTDVKGLVTADYQDYLDKNWIASLRQKYAVDINKEVLKSIKQN